MQFFLFLPQMRISFERLAETARAAEAAGFTGMAGMDHLLVPNAESQPMYEAMITNTWLVAHTERLKVGSLVLCDAMRHPAVLAKQAVSLDHASKGRFELGIGWGSWPADFEAFGVEPKTPAERVQRLRETLEVMTALWAGETATYHGSFHHLHDAAQAPTPLNKIPIVIGGSGPKTLALVREFADWWNLDTRYNDKLESGQFLDLRSEIGGARVSVQQMLGFVPRGGDRAAVTQLVRRRFGDSPMIGSGSQLVDHYAGLAERGVERVYTWFCDFAPPETVTAFGAEVIEPLRRS